MFAQVEIDDKLPKSVCRNCALKLDEFYSYRESCLRNELILLKCLANSTSRTIEEVLTADSSYVEVNF